HTRSTRDWSSDVCSSDLVTARNAVAANPSRLEVGRRHRQHVAVPFAGRKPLPRMRGVFRWMLTAVHPDRSLGLLPGDVRVDGDKIGRASCRERVWVSVWG